VEETLCVEANTPISGRKMPMRGAVGIWTDHSQNAAARRLSTSRMSIVTGDATEDE